MAPNMSSLGASAGAAGPRHRTAVGRYLSVSIAATVVHYLVFAALLRWSGPVAATALGALAGAALSYRLNHAWTFGRRGGHARALPRFAITALAVALGNAAMLAVLVPQVGAWPAQIAATASVFLAGFLANRHWSFR